MKAKIRVSADYFKKKKQPCLHRKKKSHRENIKNTLTPMDLDTAQDTIFTSPSL